HRDRQINSFFVIEGELDATLSGTNQPVGPGTLIAVQRDVPYTLHHHGPARTRVLSLHTPDRGVADCLRRVSGRAAATPE
ncbi:MAG: cupin domain-containing protein, partial [Solirubrobacteraceae bacterium]